jgi:hypothetical protein
MMTCRFTSYSTLLLGFALAGTLTIVSGCGVQIAAPLTDSSYPVAGAAITGKALGGGIPINGARVTLWETSSNGYPGSGSACYDSIGSDTVYSSLCTAASRAAGISIVLATTMSNSTGSFGFTASSYTCDSNQYIYITATGGNTGSGVNNQSVQIAPLGICSNVQTLAENNKVNIDMGEATTAGTAYALGSFTYVTDNGTGTQVIYISAPTTNNYASGSCTSPAGPAAPPNTTAASLTYAVTCNSAGLSHAFANAANIMDAVRMDGTTATGSILAAPASNASGHVPQALLNTVANALETCTNSASTSASPSAACTKLFTATTPSTPTNGAAATAPTNELQAVLNLVKDPASAAATSTTAGVFAISTPQSSSFTPALSAAPADYSVAIWYPGRSAAAPFGYPVDTAIDANDNVYVLVSDATTPTKSGVASLTAVGGSNYPATTSTAYCAPGQIATDTVGDVWFSNNTTDSTAGDPCVSELVQYSAANGTVTAPYTGLGASLYGLAIDRYNDVWYARNSGTASTATIRELFYSNGGGAGGTYAASTLYTNTSNSLGFGGSLAIDPHQNIWLGSTGAAGVQPTSSYGYTLANLTYDTVVAGVGANVPFYGYANGNEAPAAAQSAALPGAAGNGIAIDAGGNAWVPTTTAVSKLAPSYTAAVTLAISKYAIVNGTYTDEFEGTTTGNPFVNPAPGAFVLSGFATSTFLDGAVAGITSGYDAANHAYGILYPLHVPVSSTTEAGTATIEPYVSAVTLTNATTSTTVPNSKAEFDGSGALWYGNNATASTIYYYQPSNGATVSLSPCFLTAASSACATTPYFGLNGFAIDSSGSLWVSVNSEGGGAGGVLQLLGSAGPTISQLSAGFPATKP